MAEEHFVIIGNGPAGNKAALTLRDEIPEARITLISRHRGGSYMPYLLPHLVAGKIEEEDLYAFSPGSYKDSGIKLRCGQEVVGVDLDRRECLLDHREQLSFDGLIIAVGGRPRIPEHVFVFQDLMLTLKTIEDARVWINRLKSSESILIIGGDLTSLSFTKELVRMGKRVCVALNEDAFWPLRFTERLFEEVSARLSEKGVEVLRHAEIAGMSRHSDGLLAVEMEEGEIIVNLVGAFFGLVPDVRFLSGSGLKIDRGILVDEYLNTGFEGVYATGDCAQIYHPEILDYWVSVGHDNAVALGQTAALNLAGEKKKAMPSSECLTECIFDVKGVNVNTSWWMDF